MAHVAAHVAAASDWSNPAGPGGNKKRPRFCCEAGGVFLCR